MLLEVYIYVIAYNFDFIKSQLPKERKTHAEKKINFA